MKRLLILTLILFIFNLIAPMVFFAEKQSAAGAPQTTAEQTTAAVTAATMSDHADPSGDEDEAYYIGVVASLMPAEYAPEALAAQALAAKTYCGYLDRSDGADGLRAAFPPLPSLSTEEMKTLWGDLFDTYYAAFSDAVRKTQGLRLEYGGSAFPAVSFPLCAGKTEDSETVLGSRIACLVSVPSDGDSLCPGLEDVKRFGADEFFSALGLPAGADRTASVEERTGAGTVLRLTVGGKTFTGYEAANALGLASAAFSVSYENGEYAVTVRGKGNFLGMSRYGADYMARQGADFREILLHYYPGAEIR